MLRPATLLRDNTVLCRYSVCVNLADSELEGLDGYVTTMC